VLNPVYNTKLVIKYQYKTYCKTFSVRIIDLLIWYDTS